jgi:hypothetical protein
MTLSNDSKSRVNRLLIRVFALLVLITLEIILLFFVGIAYFHLVFWIFSLVFISIPFFPRLVRVLTGAELSETGRARLLRKSQSNSYKVFWLGINIFYLAILLLLLRYNIRLADMLFM